MKHADLIVHAKWVVPSETPDMVLTNHALAITNGKIDAILPSNEIDKHYSANVKETFSTHAVLPGLINSHTHIAMNVMKGLADDLDLMDWLENHIWPAETKWVSDEMVYDGSQLAMAEMIRSGTTCFNDMYFFLKDTARAAEEIGIRAHIGMTIIDVPTAWAKTTEEYFEKSIEFYEAYKSSELVTATLAPHSTYTVSKENLIKVKELAEKLKLKTNIHLQEAPAEIVGSMKKYGMRPLALLNDIGMVNENLIAMHMTQIDDSDMAILTAKKPNIVHCPESNMKLASGGCPVQMLLDAGVNVSLGTDGAASNNDLNMIGEMRSACFFGKHKSGNPKSLSAATALQMATLRGAKTLGQDKKIGSLTVGKAADFIAVDLAQVETQPCYHPISQIVYAASRHQVTDVWVAGKRLMKNRVLTTIDEKALLVKAEKWREKLG